MSFVDDGVSRIARSLQVRATPRSAPRPAMALRLPRTPSPSSTRSSRPKLRQIRNHCRRSMRCMCVRPWGPYVNGESPPDRSVCSHSSRSAPRPGTSSAYDGTAASASGRCAARWSVVGSRNLGSNCSGRSWPKWVPTRVLHGPTGSGSAVQRGAPIDGVHRVRALARLLHAIPFVAVWTRCIGRYFNSDREAAIAHDKRSRELGLRVPAYFARANTLALAPCISTHKHTHSYTGTHADARTPHANARKRTPERKHGVFPSFGGGGCGRGGEISRMDSGVMLWEHVHARHIAPYHAWATAPCGSGLTAAAELRRGAHAGSSSRYRQ